MVKKTVNQDDPSVYHLFYADEAGSPGADLTFFEYPGAPARPRRRRAWSTGSSTASAREAALGFWEERLSGAGVDAARTDGALRFADPEGLEHELVVSTAPDAPLIADAPDVPREHALQGFDGVRAYTARPGAQRPAAARHARLHGPRGRRRWELRGDERGGLYRYDAPPRRAAAAGRRHRPPRRLGVADGRTRRRGSGASPTSGARPTPVIDRFWFRSIYFREPSGVLFEIATMGPGFTTDEDPEHLGERLVLPPRFEPLRDQVERDAHAAAGPAGTICSVALTPRNAKASA